MHLASWRDVTYNKKYGDGNVLRHVLKRHPFQKMCLFLFRKGSTRVLCSRQEACYINTFYTCFHECVSVWVSVGEWYAIVRLPPLASFPRACLPCPPTASDNPASLSDASRGLQEHHLSLSHEWLYLQGYRAFSETRKANLYNCLFLFMDKHEKSLVVY